jgi:uncharacterized glyoxalase superfamily metalloenzyme YdcJ
MAKQIEVFVHENGDEPKTIKISEEETVEQLLREVSPKGHVDLLLMVEDEAKERHRRMCDVGVGHGHHVHVRPREIHYEVDGEKQTTREHKLTPRQIMTNAKIDADTHYLIELRGKKEQHSYKDKPDEPIRMHNNMKFITGSLGPTPVS